MGDRVGDTRPGMSQQQQKQHDIMKTLTSIINWMENNIAMTSMIICLLICIGLAVEILEAWRYIWF